MNWKPVEKNVRYLGRTCHVNGDLWLDYSGSGVAFVFEGTELSVTVRAEETCHKEDSAPRVGVFINDVCVADRMVREPEMTITILAKGQKEKGCVRIVKLSGTESSCLAIHSLSGIGTLSPLPECPLKIEFIGDSITCGYGVEGSLDKPYATDTENVSKAYGYLTAKELGADYSFVSLSGHGVISGYTADAVKVPDQLVMPYYSRLGKSYGKFADMVAPSDVIWDHSRFVPDVVVINLGTNDNSYCLDIKERIDEYEKAYVKLLYTVREKNPGAYILCTLGIMGDAVYSGLSKAVEEFREQTGDTKISAFHFEEQKEEDGYGADYHPSELTHQKAAKALIEELSKCVGKIE